MVSNQKGDKMQKSLWLYRDNHGKMQYRIVEHELTNSYLTQLLGQKRQLDAVQTAQGPFFFLTSSLAKTNRVNTDWCKPSLLVRDSQTRQERYRFYGNVLILKLTSDLHYQGLSEQDIQYLVQALDLQKKNPPVYVEVLHTHKFCEVYSFSANQQQELSSRSI